MRKMLAALCVAVAFAAPALASSTTMKGLHPPPAFTANGLPDGTSVSGKTTAVTDVAYMFELKPTAKMAITAPHSPPKIGVLAKSALADLRAIDHFGKQKSEPTASPPARIAGAYTLSTKATIGAVDNFFYTGDHMDRGPGGAHARLYDSGFYYRS